MRSILHATLQRQTGDAFHQVVEGIARIVAETEDPVLEVPYLTRVWMAQRNTA